MRSVETGHCQGIVIFEKVLLGDFELDGRGHSPGIALFLRGDVIRPGSLTLED